MKKLAVVISGAVSLGSYEAGVMYEVIRAIGQHNQHPDTAEEDRILIDVITGASAGGMTAVILAQKLIFQSPCLEDPEANPFYQAWVVDADIKAMLEEHDDPPEASLLSSNYIMSVAKKHLCKEYKPQENQPVHPAAAERIQVGLALANLNGIDYKISLSGFPDEADIHKRSDFFYTKHQDNLCFPVEAGNPEHLNPEYWKGKIPATCSCGAFPFAFRSLDVLRQLDDASFMGAVGLPEDSKFTYTDGGTFQNEPVGLAKRLVKQIDTDPLDYENRYYLYVSPDPKQSKSDHSFREKDASIDKTALKVASAIFDQSRFQDWIDTSSVNEEIEHFDAASLDFVKVLKDHEAKSDESLQALDVFLDGVLEVLYKGEDPDDKARDFLRLDKQFAADIDDSDLASRPLLRTVLIKTIQFHEKSAGLGERDIMTVYSITAGSEELAGDELSAFLGFCEIRLRQWDYRAGRRKAQAFLRRMQEAASPGHLPLKHFDLLPLEDPSGPNLGGANASYVSREKRELLLDRVIDRANLIAKRQGLGSLSRFAMRWFVRGKVKGLLRLDEEDYHW